MLRGKKVIVGVSGGIAAYKAADLISSLYKEGAIITVVMTEHAKEFISPLTLGTLARGQVLSDLFTERPGSVQHIEVAKQADAVLIVPATANIIAKFAHGLADDLLSTILLATTAPIFIAPAMNTQMYLHPATQYNLEILRQRGCILIEPESGLLACGDEGKGRLVENDIILSCVKMHFQMNNDFLGKHILVTAGGTQEAIDPVRFIGNRSSGKMGYAIAEAAQKRGAKVTLISGPVSLKIPAGVNFIPVTSALEMQDAVLKLFDEADITIKAAAVADYRPDVVSPNKIKKNSDFLEIKLIKNPDILKELGRLKKPHQILVGFAAETDHVEAYAKKKLTEKNLDLIIANNVALPGVGFGSETNIITMYFKDGRAVELPEMPKSSAADKILDAILTLKENEK